MSNSPNLRLLSNNYIFFKNIRVVFVFDELTKIKRLFTGFLFVGVDKSVAEDTGTETK
jgi:hypothetical protein